MNETLWKQAVEYHGHICPGVALGFRMGEEAKQIFGSTEEILCIMPTKSCITDGILVSLGATEHPEQVQIDPSVQMTVFYLADEEEGWAFTYRNLDIPKSEDSVSIILNGNRDFLFRLEPYEL